jgi:hypothetical protein
LPERYKTGFSPKIRSFRRLNRILKLENTSFNVNIGSDGSIFLLGSQFNLGNGSNRSQSFATETFGSNFKNIFCSSDL